MVTKVLQARADFLAARAALPDPLGLVLTMGALHAGHVALLDAARAASAAVVATVFVNPLQFGPADALERYPRTLDADIDRCEQAGVDLVWAPAVEDVYTAGPPQVTVAPGPLGDILEGVHRPGHFAGMLTVVAKFLNLIRPAQSYFGEKDYQQLTLIRRLVLDLELPVEIVSVSTVREMDGLALSSRNVYLSGADRLRAAALSRALQAGVLAAGSGGAATVAAARQVLAGAGVDADYVALRATDLGEPPPDGAARLLLAAHVGSTRLIDNVAVTLGSTTRDDVRGPVT